MIRKMINIISSLIKQIKFHSFIILVLICMVSISVWVYGAHIGLSKIIFRFIFILMLFLSYAIAISIYWYRQGRHEAQQNLPERELIKLQIKKKFISAITFLRHSALSHVKTRSSILYVVPWYLIIGKPFAGKTTLIKNANINISFATDVKNTCDCSDIFGFDFFFTDEAVLINTAKFDDKSNDYWHFFLNLLTKYRKKQPLNGIIYVIDYADVYNMEELLIKKLAKLIRDELNKISQILGYNFPVYIVINKIDKMIGFTDFIGNNNIELNEQSWGVKIQESTHQVGQINAIEAQLQILCHHVSSVVMSKLGCLNNNLQKINMLNFIEEFKKYTITLRELLYAVLSDNPYQETPHLLGIYFASASQFYGINELLTKTIIKDKDLLKETKQRFQNTLWTNYLALSTACAIILGVFGLYNLAYSRNVSVLKKGVTLSAQFVSVMQSQNNNGSELYALYDYYNQLLAYRKNIAWYHRLGLYKGTVLINNIYYLMLGKLTQLIIIPVDKRFQVILQNDAQQWQHDSELQRQQLRGSYYTILKAYLMLHFPQYLDVNFVDHLLMSLPEGSYDQNANSIQKSSLMNFCILQLKTMDAQEREKLSSNINTSLVFTARSQLYTTATLLNEYTQIREDGIATLGTTTLQDLLREDHVNLYTSSYTLPRLFTEQGWQQYMLPAIQQLSQSNGQRSDWVISVPLADLAGDQSNSETKLNDKIALNTQLADQLQQLYFVDYINTWVNFLNSVHVQYFISLDDAIKKLQTFSTTEEYSQLNQMIMQNIKVVNRDNFLNTPNESTYLQSLLAIKSELEPVLLSADAFRDAKQLAAQILSGNANNTSLYHASLIADQSANAIKANQLRSAYLHVLLLPIQESWRCILMLARQDLQQEWRNNVVAIYQQNLLYKIPFSAVGEDATLDDVSHFFNPMGGVLWQFVNQQLTPFLTMNLHEMHEKSWLGTGIGFTAEFLNELSHAQNISDGLFDHLGNPSSLNIEIYPEPAPGVDEINLAINGINVFRYRNEPQQWRLINWPLQNKNNDTILKVITAKDKFPLIIEINSYWSFFQLLRQAEIVKRPDDVYQIIWKMKDSKNNIYHINLLIKFINQTKMYNDILSEAFKPTSNMFVN